MAGKAPKKNGKKGRDANGRFKAGEYKGGPGRGNGKDKVCREALAIIRDAVSDEDLREVVAKLVSAAKLGNVRAATLLLSYKAGKPPETVNIGTEDGAKLTVYVEPPGN